jgi:peptidyl-prolyl cis-trans isomerase A (cyclophilin A)
MIFCRMRFGPLRLCFALAALLCSGLGAVGQTDGIFADFTTSMGSFTCRLDYAVAPKAVANFIGLATGQRAWVEQPTSRVRTNNFYDGLIFHRVITNFMIQGGSPNRMGTDGPGYVFTDEFSSTARFDSLGVLAMANSGTNSNGSQFFITVAPTTWLNDRHTIFGKVTSGTNVVVAISKVPTNSTSRPLTDVVIQQIRIRRVGATAQAFDINAQGLPIVRDLNLGIGRAGTNISITFSNRAFVDNRLYISTNLADWVEQQLGIELGTPSSGTLSGTALGAKQFFRAVQVHYASSTLAPQTMLGRKLVLTFDTLGWVITNTFDGNGGGSYTRSSGPSGSILACAWTQGLYNGRIWPIYYSDPNFGYAYLKLDFTSETQGRFSGTFLYYSGPSGDVSGKFTLQ